MGEPHPDHSTNPAQAGFFCRHDAFRRTRMTHSSISGREIIFSQHFRNVTVTKQQ